MITKDEAIALIEARLAKQDRVIVALDGMSCSGKSTFAKALAEKFSGAVVHMDDFFLPQDRFTEEMQALPGGNMDRARFQNEVLSPLAAGQDFAYRAFSCQEQSLLPDEVPVSGRLIIVEGAYALLPAWGQYYDLALFLQVSQEEQQGRLLLRNGARGMVAFLTRWIPREESYFAACDVRARCDAIVDGEE
jgi:uridine kinase